jgi:GTP cyclohydrolase II
LGNVSAVAYEREIDNGSRHVETAVALMMGDTAGRVPLVRIHSQCFTGEILGKLGIAVTHSEAIITSIKSSDYAALRPAAGRTTDVAPEGIP